MIQALLGLAPTLLPSIINIFKEKIKEKAPENLKEVIEGVFKNKELEAELQKELLKALSNYNEQILKELEIRERYKNINKVAQMVRPFITFASFITFEVSMIYGLYSGKLTFSEFVNVFTPINTMLLGFWFGERTALKDPKKAITED